MACGELQCMREQVRELSRELVQRRRTALQRSSVPRAGDRGNELEWFLQRRITKAAAEIQRHLSQHGCALNDS